MDTIDALILQYNEMATGYYDDIDIIELNKINQLYGKYSETNEDIFVTEIIETFLKLINTQKERILDFDVFALDETDLTNIVAAFCKIVKTQRELISCLEQKSETELDEGDFLPDNQGFKASLFSTNEKNFAHGFMPRQNIPTAEVAKKDFQNDEQLQAAFTAYCLNDGKSSYTANDYCSRIKNLWKNFYNDYKEGTLEDSLKPNEQMINPNHPLLNVYNHTNVLYRYILIKIDETDSNRNWTNARAAFNKFDEFRVENK